MDDNDRLDTPSIPVPVPAGAAEELEPVRRSATPVPPRRWATQGPRRCVRTARTPRGHLAARSRGRRGGRGRGRGRAGGSGATAGDQQPRSDGPVMASAPAPSDDSTRRSRSRSRRGRSPERKRPMGRYLMCVHATPGATHIATLEGRNLVEHSVAKATNDRPRSTGTSTSVGSRTCCPAWRRRSSTSGSRRMASSIAATSVRPGRRRAVPVAPSLAADRRDAQVRPDDPVPGHEEPDRGQGRPAHPGGLAPRPVRGPRAQLVRRSGSPSAWGTRAAAPPQDHRRDPPRRPRAHRAHRRRGRLGRGAAARRRSLVAKWSEIESRAATSNQPRLVYQDLDLAVRILREELNERLPRRAHRRPGALRQGAWLRPGRQPRARRPHRVLRPRARGLAAVRALLRPRAAPQGARAQGVAALGRFAHHRADRGADRDRRQHRQEHRQVEPRRDGLSQQPRGSGRGGAPAAPSRHRRDHRHRLHRHGDQAEPRGGRPPCARAWRGTRRAPRCSTSPSSGWSR